MYDYTSMPKRFIFCVDLKSFYASCSARMLGLNPLRDKLAVVGDREREGSVVLSATPPLKAWGIKQGSRLYDIPRRSDVTIVNPSMQHYVCVSNYISRILLQYVAPEDYFQFSIDEAFLDVTASLHLFAPSPVALATIMQNGILKETGIYSCIGIGPNLLLANVSLNNEAKAVPSGIAHWTYDDVPGKLWAIKPLSNVFGIGRNTENKLNRMGIYTVGALAKYPVQLLERQFGKVIGQELHEHANGIDYSRISERYTPAARSIGKSQTLFRDYTSRKDIQIVILEHAEEVCFRLRTQGLLCRTVQFGLGYSRHYGGGFSVSRTMGHPSNLTMEIYDVCLAIFHEKYDGEPVRTLYLSVSNLLGDDMEQLSLFRDEEKRQKEKQLAQAMDRIRMKFGTNSILRAVSYTPAGTGRERNTKLGGHQA